MSRPDEQEISEQAEIAYNAFHDYVGCVQLNWRDVPPIHKQRWANVARQLSGRRILAAGLASTSVVMSRPTAKNLIELSTSLIRAIECLAGTGESRTMEAAKLCAARASAAIEQAKKEIAE